MKLGHISALAFASWIGCVPWLNADVLVFKDGSVSEVRSIEIRDKAVHFITLTGKKMAIIRDAIDVAATLAANETVEKPAKPPVPQPEAVPPKPPSPIAETREEPPHVTPPARTPPRLPPPSPDEPTQTLPSRPSATAVDTASSGHRFALYVNGALGTSPFEFTDSQRFELFLEEAQIDNRYQAPEVRGIEVGGFFRVKGLLGVGTSVEIARNNREAAFSAFLPHPFFFEQFRELSGSRSGLVHEERAIHLDAVLSKSWGRRFSLDLYGGPSWFITKTEVLVDVLYSEVYPYDAVIPLGVETQVFEDRPLGYNVGASATYRIAGSVGVDFGLRFSKARIRLTPLDDRVIEFDAGGLRAGAGLRFLFW